MKSFDQNEEPVARFSPGTPVRLESFHREKEAPQDVRRTENYWLLIGATGIVVGDEVSDGLAIHKDGRRVLVRFDQSVTTLGLECHNRTANALYLFVDDLSILG